MKGVPAALAAGLAALAATPALTEAAATTFRGCEPALRGFACTTLKVPLDRSGRVPGTVAIKVARQRDAPAGARTLVVLFGGPGQAAADAAPFVAVDQGSALKRYRLVLVDQRGTGVSALRCPGLQRLRSLDTDAADSTAACARRLGPRRAFYTTTDSVDDLEDLRQALDVPSLALQGTSYGTYVALGYARRYPASTDRLVLDSSVAPDGVDTFQRETFSAFGRVLRAQCAGGACAAITADPVADARALAARLERVPLRGLVREAGGRRVARTVTAAGLATLLVSGDLNPHLRAGLPAAVRSALAGDGLPLLRLVRPALGPPLGTRELSAGLYAATSCTDVRLSYPLSTPFAARASASAAALSAADASAFGPFSRAVVRRFSYDLACRRWPDGPSAAPASGPPADVPALLLNGELDLRTPTENARAIAALLPRAQVVEVPGTGHDEIGSDRSGCVRTVLRRFFADRPVGPPCRSSNAVAPQPVAPRSLAAVAPFPELGGARGRVLAAAVGALNNVREQLLIAATAGLPDGDGAGLRGGRWRVAGENGFVLDDVAWAPGVTISGTVRSLRGRYRGTLRVRAPGGGGGVLRLHPRRGATGTLGGRRVRLPARRIRGALERSLLR